MTSGLNSATALGSVTHGTWSNSGIGIPKRSNTPYLIAGAAAAVLLTIGGIVIAVSRSGDGGEAVASNAVSASVTPAAVPPQAVTSAAAVAVAPVVNPIPVVPVASVKEVEAAPATEAKEKETPKSSRESSSARARVSSVSRPRVVAPQAQPRPKARNKQDDWGY